MVGISAAESIDEETDTLRPFVSTSFQSQDTPKGELVRTLPSRVVRRVWQKGLFDTARRTCFLADQTMRERWLGIDTQDFIPWHAISDDPDCVDYDPIGYRTCARALNMLEIEPGRDVFLDYGCGKGRVLVLAARRAFRRVIGVELSHALADQARRNLSAAKRRLNCRSIEVVHQDARQYAIPSYATVFFLFNPFGGNILRTVQAKIYQSWLDYPRRIQLLYVHPPPRRRFIRRVRLALFCAIPTERGPTSISPLHPVIAAKSATHGDS